MSPPSTNPREQDPSTPAVALLAREIEVDLLTRFGTMLTAETLQRELGYSSTSAFRKAIERGWLPFPTFEVPHRRGRFALAKDLAAFLARQSREPTGQAATGQRPRQRRAAREPGRTPPGPRSHPHNPAVEEDPPMS